MKRNTFLQGAYIATLAIMISKILGLLYVIPFYSIIGEKGGALYGYAYNLYTIFINISTAGIPFAISKLISEYHALGQYRAKETVFKIGKKIAVTLSLISFIVLFTMSPVFAHRIIGNIQGGNSIEDIILVIRIISTAILIVPILSIYRGYLQGHNYIKESSISQVLEQIARISVILLGSYISYKLLKSSLSIAIGWAVFGATVGALVAYMYLFIKVFKNKKQFKISIQKDEEFIDSKVIIKKIIIYAMPFILINLFKSLYDSVDVMMLNHILVNEIGYSVEVAETTLAIITTWGEKLNMIVTAIATGVITSLIPSLSSSFIKNDVDDIQNKVNKTFQVLLYLTIPMTIGLSLLSKPVWMILYGSSGYGAEVFSLYIFLALATVLFMSTTTLTQVLKQYKIVYISIIIGFFIKLFLNKPLIIFFNSVKLPAYSGSLVASILGLLAIAFICICRLKSQFKINFKTTLKHFSTILMASICLIISIFLLRLVFPTVNTNRLMNILLVSIYGIIGSAVYLTISYKTFNEIFGKSLVKKY